MDLQPWIFVSIIRDNEVINKIHTKFKGGVLCQL